MEKEKVLDFIINYLIERGVEVSSHNYNKINIIEDGIIDSFAILALFMAIEGEFDVKITPNDMLEEKNKTIDGLVNLIINRI